MQVQPTMSPHVSEEVRTCIEIVLKCVEDDRTRMPTIAQIVNELSKIGIGKSSPVSQVHILCSCGSSLIFHDWPYVFHRPTLIHMFPALT